VDNVTIDEIQDKIIAQFSGLADWFDKYEYIIALGRDLAPLDDRLKTAENAVQGCQSKVWIYSELTGDKLSFFADSDALITKGLIALVLRVFNHQTPEDIADTELYFIERIGLSSNLSPSRANGLISIVKRMKWHAQTHQKKLL
jgi:cysteine desulfuration protein SufE